ncbi:MAG: tetratricopeptide repeat protein, partial [Geitlerinemataceae cyanobacterium]
MSLILTWLSAVIFSVSTALGHFFPALTPVNPTPISREQLAQLEELAKNASNAFNNGDLATSDRFWSEAIEQFPNNPALWSNRGNVRAGRNQLELAISDYDRSIELAPDLPDAYLNRGAAYEGLGDYPQALANYDRVLELEPDDAAAYNNRGNAKAGLQDWEG